MTANTNLIHAIADALIEAHGQDATEWLECGGRATVERGLAGWRAAITNRAWIDRPEDILVLRALRHVEHTVELAGGARIEARIRSLVDEDRHGRRPGAKARIGEVFAHELLCGDTGEPFESIEYAFREHGREVRGEDDEQPWNAAPALSGASGRVEVCLAEARYVERRIPFLDLPGRVRQAKAMTDAGDERGWTPVDDGPVFRYLRGIREEGEQRMVPPDLRLRTVYLIELVCPPDRSVVVAQEGLRGRLEDIASNAVANARVAGVAQVAGAPDAPAHRLAQRAARVPVLGDPLRAPDLHGDPARRLPGLFPVKRNEKLPVPDPRPAGGAGPPSILHSSRTCPLRRGQSRPKLAPGTKLPRQGSKRSPSAILTCLARPARSTLRIRVPSSRISPARAAPLSRAISARPGPSAGAGAASIIGATDQNGEHGPGAANGSSQANSPQRAASRSASVCRRRGKGASRNEGAPPANGGRACA